MAPTVPGTGALPTPRLSLRSLLVFARDAQDDCLNGNKDPSFCEKPSSSNTTVAIVVGILVPLLIALCLVFYFHRKGSKRRAREDMADPNNGLDFGIEGGDSVGGKGSKRKSMFREKMMNIDPRHRAQISMDMNLTSPYLLPPALQGSKESLHSLARGINNHEDPYRMVHQYGSDVGSLRSFRNDKETAVTGASSTYTRSTERRDTVNSKERDLPPRGHSSSP